MNNGGDSYGYPRRHLFGWIIAGLLILLVIGVVAVPFFYSGMMGTAPGPYYPWYGRGSFFFFPFGLLFVFILIFFLVRVAFWGSGWRGYGWYGGYRGHGDPEQIIRRRYARGEITKEQFDQMLRDLRASNSQQPGN